MGSAPAVWKGVGGEFPAAPDVLELHLSAGGPVSAARRVFFQGIAMTPELQQLLAVAGLAVALAAALAATRFRGW